jgi:cytidylate kinase
MSTTIHFGTRYDPDVDTRAAPRKVIARKSGWPTPGKFVRLELTDPRELAVYDLLISTQGFRYDEMAKKIVAKLDAMAMTELHQLDRAVTA